MNENKKIIFILHNLYGGGAEKMMVRLANKLAENSFQVTMVLISDTGVNLKNVSPLVEILCFHKKRTLHSIFTLASFLRNREYDAAISALTHINFLSIISSFFAFKIDKLHVSERNFFSLDKEVNKSAIMRFVYRLMPYLYRLIPNRVICVSDGVADDLVKNHGVPKNKTVIAVNPTLDDNYLNVSYIPLQLQHPWLSLNRTYKVIVAAGRLSEQKGFDTLIKSFHKVRSKFDSRLIIYGEGHLKHELLTLIEQLNLNEYVSLAGYSEHLINNIALSDLFVMSSRFEGSPNVLVEAISTGVMVVSTDCPHGPRGILKRDDLLVEVDNIEEMSTKIIDMFLGKIEKSPRESVIIYTSSEAAKEYAKIMRL